MSSRHPDRSTARKNNEEVLAQLSKSYNILIRIAFFILHALDNLSAIFFL